ncbi:MAG: hypothetical protein ACRCRZ_02930 [Metamycoplasmataceae bacterium]
MEKNHSENIHYPKIKYSNYNPFIFSEKQKTCPKFKNLYNGVKFSIIFLIAFVALISLWFSTQWSKDTLTNLGYNVSDQYKSYGLIDFKESSFKDAMLQSLIAFSFICLFTTIPMMLFKNGTLISIISIAFGFVILILITIFFAIGLKSQMDIVSLFSI